MTTAAHTPFTGPPPWNGIVGRDRELSEVAAALATAATTGPTAIVVLGEAGIGKSAVWQASLEHAAGHGMRILTHRAVEAEARWQFGGLGDLIGSELDEIRLSLAEPRRAALEVALLLADPGGRPADARAIGLAVLDAITLLARDVPLVLAIDDLQWLDRSSAEVIGFAMRRLRTSGANLLATLRLPAGEASPLLDRLPETVRRRDVRLGPLPVSSLYTLLLGHTGIKLRRPELVRLAESTGGNPLFALEVGREMARTGRRLDPAEPMPIPEDVERLLQARLGRLDARTVEVLASAAALSRPTIELLNTIHGPQAVDRSLAVASEASIVHRSAGVVRFDHPMYASVLAGSIGAGRRAVHRRIAAVIKDPEERAVHLALAGAASRDTASALDDAATRAMARGATAGAAELAELAARVGPAADVHARRDRILRAAEAHRLAGDRDRARRLLDPLLDEQDLAANERAEVLFAIARGRRDPLPRLAELTEQAIGLLPPDDPRRSDMLVYLSWMRLLLGLVPAGLAAARQALELAERHPDAARVARAIARVAQAELLAVDVTPGLLERGIWLEASIRSESGVVLEFHENPLITQTQYLLRMGAFDEARRLLESLAAAAVDRGDEGTHGHLLFHLIQLEGYAGRWDAAMAHATIALDLAEQLEDAEFRGLILATTARIHACLGDSSLALELSTEALAVAKEVGDALSEIDALSVIGFVHLSEDRVEDAVVAGGELPRRLLTLGYRDPSHQAWASSVESLIASDRLDRARPLLAEWSAIAAQRGSPRALGPIARAEGLLRAATSENGEALDWFDRALVQFARYPAPFETARTRLARGACLRTLRRRAEARAELDAAVAAFGTLGAAVWERRARRELARIGGRRRAGSKLTPTQRRVVDRVLAARSNKEIAADLGLSVNTVEAHLTAVYRALEIGSRVELVRRMDEVGEAIP